MLAGDPDDGKRALRVRPVDNSASEAPPRGGVGGGDAGGRPRFNIPYGTYLYSKSRFRAHSANMKNFNQKCSFTNVLVTSAVIFWILRTPEFIIKYKEIGSGWTVCLLKYSVFLIA